MIVPMGPPPLMVTVRLSFSPLSMPPIIEVAISVRPSAAVAVRDRLVDLPGALDQLRAFDEDGAGLTAQQGYIVHSVHLQNVHLRSPRKKMYALFLRAGRIEGLVAEDFHILETLRLQPRGQFRRAVGALFVFFLKAAVAAVRLAHEEGDVHAQDAALFIEAVLPEVGGLLALLAEKAVAEQLFPACSGKIRRTPAPRRGG